MLLPFIPLCCRIHRRGTKTMKPKLAVFFICLAALCVNASEPWYFLLNFQYGIRGVEHSTGPHEVALTASEGGRLALPFRLVVVASLSCEDVTSTTVSPGIDETLVIPVGHNNGSVTITATPTPTGTGLRGSRPGAGTYSQTMARWLRSPPPPLGLTR